MMISMFTGFMTQMSSMMSQPPGPMSSFPHVYPHYNHATGNPIFPGQDFMPNYSSVPFTNRSSVDNDPELDPMYNLINSTLYNCINSLSKQQVFMLSI